MGSACSARGATAKHIMPTGVGKIRGFKVPSFKGPGGKANVQTSETRNPLADKRSDGMTAKEAGAAGYPPAAIREAGYTTAEMAGALKEVKEAGLTASQAYAAGFTHAEMEQAGYSSDMVEAATGQLSEAGNGVTLASGVEAVVKVNHSVPPAPENTATENTAAPRNDNGGVKRLMLKLPFSTVPKLPFKAGRAPAGKPLDCSRSAVDRLKEQNEQQQQQIEAQQKEIEQQQSAMRLVQASEQQLAALQEQLAQHEATEQRSASDLGLAREEAARLREAKDEVRRWSEG